MDQGQYMINAKKVVDSSINLKALGIVTSASGKKFPKINADELKMKLIDNGAYAELIDYAATHECSINGFWRENIKAVKTLMKMREMAAAKI